MVAGDDDGGGGGGGKMSKSEKDQVGRRGPSLYFLRGCLFFTLLLRKVQRKAVLLRATQLVARPAVFLRGPSESRKRGISAAAAVASFRCRQPPPCWRSQSVVQRRDSGMYVWHRPAFSRSASRVVIACAPRDRSVVDRRPVPQIMLLTPISTREHTFSCVVQREWAASCHWWKVWKMPVNVLISGICHTPQKQKRKTRPFRHLN